MENRKIELGPVIYEIQRFYNGNRPAAEIILDRVINEQQKTSFDNKAEPVVE